MNLQKSLMMAYLSLFVWLIYVSAGSAVTATTTTWIPALEMSTEVTAGTLFPPLDRRGGRNHGTRKPKGREEPTSTERPAWVAALERTMEHEPNKDTPESGRRDRESGKEDHESEKEDHESEKEDHESEKEDQESEQSDRNLARK